MKTGAIVWHAALGFRASLAAIALLCALVALLESATLLALFSLVAGLTQQAAVSARTSTGFAGLLGALSPRDLSLLIFSLATVRYGLSLVLEASMSRLWVAMRSRMQQSMFEAHLSASFGYLAARKAGNHVYEIIEGPSHAAVFYLHLARYLATVILLVVLFATLFYVSPFLIGVAGAIAIVYGIAIRRVSVHISYASGQQQADAIRDQNQLVNEGLAGVRYLKTLQAVPAWLENFGTAARAAESAMRRAGFWSAVPARTLEYLVLVAFLGVVGYALQSGGNIIAALPTIAIYFLGIIRVLPALSMLGNGRMQMMNSLPNLEQFVRLRDSIEREPMEVGARDLPDLAENPISFVDVAFAYPGKRVFEGLNCAFEPGRVTAIVGQSGGGKSTLVDLLLRLIAPERGRIMAGNRDLAGIALSEWRRHIAYVGQDPFLFHASVLDNVRLGRADATEAEAIAAAERVGAAKFVAELPRGWGTILADRGQSLSGGQRQRIALVRALLSRAELLILDEPTSALDAESEARVLSGILMERGNRTVLLITHSHEAMRLADTIIVLEDGGVVGAGSYELLNRPGTRFHQILSRDAVRDEARSTT